MFVKAPMALRYASLVSLLFFIAALAVPEGLMRLLTRNEKLVSLGAGYLRWVSASYLMIGVSQIQLAVMKSMPCFATGKLSVPGKCTVPLRKYRTIRRHIWRCLFRHLLLADFSIYRQVNLRNLQLHLSKNSLAS